MCLSNKEFKKLIESQLEKMMSDLGITTDQFLKACSVGLHDTENAKFFEQLITCDNFNYFKGMMVRRNIQLQEEAYRMLFNQLEQSGWGFGAKEQAEMAKQMGIEGEIDINAILKRAFLNRI